VEKTNRRFRIWGWIILGAIAYVGFSALVWRPIGILSIPTVLIGFVGFLVAPGVWLIHLILKSRFQNFWKKNFS
jgi:hypothetical protein